MAAINSVQRMGWPVSASTLAAASRALRRLFSASAGGAASVFVALAVFFAAVALAEFFFLLAMMLLLENAGYKTRYRAGRGTGTLSRVTSPVEQQSRQSCVEF